MSAVRYTILIEQGSTLRFPIGVTNPDANAPWDLTGCTARMQIRPSIASPEVIHSLTTENGGLTIDGAEGVIMVEIDAVTTAAFDFKAAVYDLELEKPDGDVIRLIEGKVKLSLEVTR